MSSTSLFVLLIIIAPLPVFASCSGTTGIDTHNFGTITIPANSAPEPGIVYYSRDTYTTNNPYYNITCTTPSFTLAGMVPNPVPNDVTTQQLMLDTGIWSGLGVKLGFDYRGTYTSRELWAPDSEKINSAAFDQTVNGSPVSQIDIIGTGTVIVPGNVSMYLSGVFTADGYPVEDYKISGTIVAGSCIVDSATPQTVDLGTVYSSSLPSIGSVSNPKKFSIVLNCNANVSVNLTMSGTEDGNIPGKGVLMLSATGEEQDSAAGVGVQLLYNDIPVPLNQIVNVGQATNGQFEIPLTAQYYRTQEKLLSGEVNAVATYTLTYL